MSMMNPEQMNDILNELKLGTVLVRRKHDGEKSSRHFYLHKSEQFITHHQLDKTFGSPTRYYINKIDEVRVGLNTRTFDRLVRHKLLEQDNDRCAFSIFFNNYRNELHFLANDENIRNIWVEGLRYLMETHAQKRQRHLINEANWILNYFYLADKDGSKSLSKSECRRLLTDSLNAKVSAKDFDKLFQEADRSGEGLLTADEFLEFFHTLTRRRDLYNIMRKYAKNDENHTIDSIYLTTEELLEFLQKEQNQVMLKTPKTDSKFEFSLEIVNTCEQVQELIKEFELNDEIREKGHLSLKGFRNLLLSDDFALMKPWCSRFVYQDMTRPLSDYYIKTSHNTYLFNNQIVGDSNPEAYNRALKAGCRAVEIDCYDGDNGRPIVKHGFTLVKPCLFESIIRFIEPNLFKASPYPVILDLENHCSIEQQHEMARILQRILGDRLISEPLLTKDSSVLPSPEDLKYKVLIRGVKLPAPVDEPQITEEKSPYLFFYLQNVPYLDYEKAKNSHECYHSANLAEKHFDRACKADPLGVIKQTLKSSLRMYPDGLRQDSSNPDPIAPWNFGIQMVALNYQNDDSVMSLSYGKFMDNGGCGYVLKPKYLTDIDKSLFNPLNFIVKPPALSECIFERPQRLIIKVISGQFLPRANETTTDIPDPYVLISTHGIPCDKQTKKTKKIDDNGFDPEWNETFQFDIHFPQMCLIRFDVYDHDRFSRDDRLAYFCLPVTAMQTGSTLLDADVCIYLILFVGYRHIHLRAKNNNLTYSTIFIHVQFKPI
ncbi:unnamed protein product [Adineta ricciae]|uniref:Phosphoinositide phospholipase C n=1 Tax=Adineta ricciae TaxID=249248 RepID=A0A815NTI3_ADIRI|nr:unnamed protein product [Adineta ricciae]CAF1438947.1 unnamed protein product [Adineta ricciae]